MNRRSAKVGGERAGSVFRIYIGGNAIVSWYMAFYEPRSIMRLIASTSEGAALMWLLLLVGSAALLDAAINDFL